MNEDILKCNRCKKTMINEEYSTPICSPIPNGKIIKVDIDYYTISKNQLGETVLMIKDLEGTSYRFTVKENNEYWVFHQPISNTLSHQRKTNNGIKHPMMKQNLNFCLCIRN